MTVKEYDKLLESVREAAWNGEHAQAIAVCTNGLDQQDLADSQRMDLLDVRAESYIAQGKLDLARQDVRQMHQIADKKELPLFKAISFNRQAWVEIVQGSLDQAITSATTAVVAARETDNQQLLADCLLALGVAHRRARHLEPVFEALNEAAILYGQLGNLAGESRALHYLAIHYMDVGDMTAYRRTVERAEGLAREAGDQYSLGDALHTLAIQEPNIALSIRRFNEALIAFRNVGYVERQSVVLGSLAASYNSLGLHRHARWLATEAQAIARQVGALMAMAWATGDIFNSEFGLGNIAAARQALDELIRIAAILDTPYWNMGVNASKAEMATLENDLPTAIEYYRKTLHQDHAASDVTCYDDLAETYLALNDYQAAFEHSSRAIELLADEEVGEYKFQRIWWHHSQALMGIGEKESAAKALQKAYHYLIRAIADVGDEGLRRSFLNKLPEHRQLIDGWLKHGRARGLGQDELYAHLTGEADLREPFHRLVDTGLRLNQLHTEEELFEFLIDEATELVGAERVLLVLDGREQQELAGSLVPRGEDSQALLEVLGERLEEARQSRTVQLEAAASPDSPSPSRITAPLIAQNRVLGFLYADMEARYGSFGQTDADMLGMLASQAAVALENVRLVEGLEEQVTERTAELQDANKQAEEARQVAEEANQAKSTFLANMSHELRTPLNAIIGFTRIVKRKAKRTNLPEKQIDNLGKVQSSAEHLLGLINTILDIAKIEAGGMDVHAQEFEVAPLIEMCLATAQPLAKAGVEMRSDIAPDLPKAYSDQDKIKQILLNLLSNAAKFTHEGEIVASCELRVARETMDPPPATRHSLLVLAVQDTGIGMNEEQLDRVFEEFQQADATTTRKYGGTGLGLPISKQLAQLLGGDLAASSAQGQGSTFRLALPLRYTDPETKE